MCRMPPALRRQTDGGAEIPTDEAEKAAAAGEAKAEARSYMRLTWAALGGGSTGDFERLPLPLARLLCDADAACRGIAYSALGAIFKHAAAPGLKARDILPAPFCPPLLPAPSARPFCPPLLPAPFWPPLLAAHSQLSVYQPSQGPLSCASLEKSLYRDTDMYVYSCY